MRFRLGNVRSLHRVAFIITVLRELQKYMLDLLGMKGLRWPSGTEPVGEYTFFYRKGNENHKLGTDFFVHKRIISAVKRVEFVSDRMLYIILRGRWSHIFVLNVHDPTEYKTRVL
jgi:catechol 2,3-dioxygenase-like lactoylglutathione lyase family enzyme